MSESWLSSIPLIGGMRESVPPVGGEEEDSRVADGSGGHFRDFLQGVNPRHDLELARYDEGMSEGRVAALTTPVAGRQIGDAVGEERIGQLYAPSKAYVASAYEGWTVIAPSVARAAADRPVVTANAGFRIYARAREEALEQAAREQALREQVAREQTEREQRPVTPGILAGNVDMRQ